MKNAMKNRGPDGPVRVARVVLMSAALMLSGTALPAGANSLNLDFTYTVVQGTCQIDVSPSSLDFQDVKDLSTAVNANWVVLNQQVLNVTLSACDGAADPATRPAIELQGTRASDAGASPSRQNSVFTTDNKSGFGVVFANAPGATSLGAGNLLAYDANKGGLYFYTGAANTTAANGLYTIRTGLACGTTADCAASRLSVDSGNATVTFSFTYR